MLQLHQGMSQENLVVKLVLNKKNKAGVTCTPSTPAPARKRRRPNQDLQERLARCEKLLQQYAAAGSPPGQSTEHSPSTPLPNSIKQDMWDTSPEGTDSQQTFKKTGRIVQEDGGARFMDSEIWATMSEEVKFPFVYDLRSLCLSTLLTYIHFL